MWQKLVNKWRITYTSTRTTFHTNMIKSNDKLIFNLYNIMKLVLESDLTFENQMILLWKVIINLATRQKIWTILKFLEYWNMWNIKYFIMNFTQHPFKFGFLHFAWFYLNYVVWLFMFYMYFSKRTSFSMFCILESNSNSTQFPWKKKCQPTTYFWTLKNNHLKITCLRSK